MLKRVDRFEIVGTLAEGRGAVRYRAVDHTDGASVILCVVERRIAGRASTDRLERVLDGPAPTHENVIRIRGASTDRDALYLAFEDTGGRSLAEAMAESGPMAVGMALPLVIALAEGLTAFHATGFAHGLLAPVSVLVSADGTPKLMPPAVEHFEAAVDGGSRDMARAPYAAPECVRGEPFDERADVFSLGALAFELLTGRTPFASTTLAELVDRIASDANLDGLEFSGLPARAAAAIGRALDKSPAGRQAAVGEFVQDLAGAMTASHDERLDDGDALAERDDLRLEDAEARARPARETLGSRVASHLPGLVLLVGILVILAAAGYCTAARILH